MNKIILGAIILSMTIGGVACKTNEKNYRQAYEKAITKDKEGIDDATYAKIKEEEKGAKVVISGDSVRVKSEFVNLCHGEQKDMMPYGIVVGQFKQIFNARSFCDRLKSKGYPAYALENRDNIYYVVAKGFATEIEAAAYLKNINKNIPFAIPVESAWILAQIR